jgi:hypothetical protein
MTGVEAVLGVTHCGVLSVRAGLCGVSACVLAGLPLERRLSAAEMLPLIVTPLGLP